MLLASFIFSGLNVFQELIIAIIALLVIICIVFLIWILNKLRLELTHIRSITALIAEKNGVMFRIKCPECDNIFWEDATKEYTVCNYCNYDFRIEDIDIISKKSEIYNDFNMSRQHSFEK
jgi:uncharacterized C2H2 Zn-finger protein